MPVSAPRFGRLHMGNDYSSPKLTPIRASINRPQMLLGCDREMVLFAGLLSAVVVVSMMTLTSFLLGLGLWLAAVAVLSRFGKADPMMRQVYRRHVRYRGWYPARGFIHEASRSTPGSWRGKRG